MVQYRLCADSQGSWAYERKNYEEAIKLLTDTFTYPDNLGEGKLPNVLDNIAEYYIGCLLCGP